MNILIQPSSLSLVGSMNHIVINTEKEVSFVLSDSGGNAIVKHLYVPSDTNRIEVDLKNIILPLLTFKLQDVSSPYQQSGIVKSFSVTITETGDGGETKTFSFTVIRAGVDHFDGDASSFLTQNFLTWQPNVKPVTYYTPEFLTYYAVVAATIRCKAYFEDGTTQTIALAQISAGECWTVPVQYAVIAGKVSNKLPQYYEVWAENASGSRLTYIQRYVASDMRSEEEEWILFENSLGGIDTFRAYGDSENTAKHTHNVAEIEEDFEEYRVDTTREHKKNTGYLGNRERVWLLDFFPSTGKYVYTDNFIRRIVVTESDVSYNAKELPSNYNFTYKYADARPYLNLPRAELPQKVLNIKIPELGSFTVAPRLAEFPRLTLSGGALFPVENPYSEQWTVTTAAAILEYLIHEIEADYSGNGGIGHTHPNINLLNGLYLLEDYLLANGNKIKAGYADEAKRLTTGSPVYNQFLRKDKDDSTPYNLGVERSLKVGQNLNVNGDAAVDGSLDVAIDTKSKDLDVTNQATTEKLVVNDTSVFGGAMSSKLFRSGFLDGYGWSLFKQVVENALGVGEDKYTLEIDNLIVRQSMRVYEMIISQLLGENDNRVFTAMMEVDHYEASSGKVYFNNHDGKLYNPFRKYDYVMVQQYNPSATSGWVIKHYELIVAEVGSDSDSEGNRKDWVKFYNFTSSSGASASELIANGDTFVRVDNAVDPERKGIVTITTVGANTPYIDIVHGLKTDPRHAMKGRIGNLEGLQTEQFGWLKGFGEYLSNLYAVGHFKLASTGENVSARIEANSQQLSSTYSETTYNIKEEDNYIPNGMFAQGLDKWGVVDSGGLTEISNDLTDEEKNANLVTVTDGTNTVPLFLNGGTVGTKHTHHAVAETFDGTKVAHLYECGIFQPWSQLKANGTHAKYPTDASKSEEYEQNTLYFAIRFLAVTSGVLTLEFHDDEDTSDISTVVPWNITASDQWQMKESNNKSANWKYDPAKKGRLIITYSGEMLVRFVTLTDAPLDDFKQSVSTQFLQTANSIKQLGENYNSLSGELTNLGIELRAADKDIRLYVDKQTSDAETRLGVRIDGVEEKVSLYASKLDSDYYTKSEIDVKVDEINSSVSGINTRLSNNDDDIAALQKVDEEIRNLAINAAKAEVYTQSANPWQLWESGKQKEHVGAIWHYQFQEGETNANTETPTITFIDGREVHATVGSSYRYIGYDDNNKWECIDEIAASASYILQNKDYISAVVANFDKDGKVLEASGIVTTTNFSSIYAEKIDPKGDIVKKAELSVFVKKTENNEIESGISLNADQININATHAMRITVDGALTIATTNFQLDADGTITSKAGKIGGWTIEANALKATYDSKAKILVENGDSFLRLGGLSSNTFLSIRNDSGTCISMECYSGNNPAISILSNVGTSTAIKSFGNNIFTSRVGEGTIINRLCFGIAETSTDYNFDKGYDIGDSNESAYPANVVICENKSSEIKVTMPNQPKKGTLCIAIQRSDTKIHFLGNGHSFQHGSERAAAADVNSNSNGQWNVFLFTGTEWQCAYFRERLW